MKKGEATKKTQQVQEQQKIQDEILQLYISAKNGHLEEIDRNEQQYVEEVTKYWLVHHGCKSIRITGPEPKYHGFLTAGLVIGLLVAMLVILYYLPV